MKRPLLYFFYLLYCVEAGLFLCLAPWSRIWSNSYFAQMPGLREVLLSGSLRGGVSAIGVMHLIVAWKDFLGFCRALKQP